MLCYLPRLRIVQLQTINAIPVYLLICVVFFPLFSVEVAAEIDRTRSNEIVQLMEQEQFEGFQDFLIRLRSFSTIDDETTQVINNYLQDQAIPEDLKNTLYRLLGIYTRLAYGDKALGTLAQLVAIPTFAVAGLPQHENPNFHRFADVLGAIAIEFGLDFRNVDNRIYEINLSGTGDELVGIHAHGDVVPVNPDLWVLEDGTKLDPFKVTRIGNRLYGRGTEDDKNGIVASMYAMKVIKEENLALLRNIRLLVDTTEETSSLAIPYYFERNPTPDYNIALDGSYPVVIAEKGFGTVMAHFPVRKGSGEGAEIISVSGGLATNQIPAASVARVRSARPEELVSVLNEAGTLYTAGHGADFQIFASSDSNIVMLTVQGVSAHSSEPASGVNPVSRMLDFIHNLHGQAVFQSNHITDAAHYASENWGLDYLGNTLGIAYQNDFMGPLTAALTYIALDDEKMQLAVNLRLPVGRAPDELLAEISSRLESWSQTSKITATFKFSADEPMYRNPEGAWVNALLDIAAENLDIPRQFGSSAGATSIHDLPNGVQFGLAMPDEKYSGHNANEFKTIDQFMIDLQIVTEMFARIGGMPRL